MRCEFLISPEELEGLLGKPGVSIVNASWFLPTTKRDAKSEYLEERIPGSVFFDIDEIIDASSALPHMLASPQDFAAAVGELGISNEDEIIVYDGPGLFSSARVWWNFRIMGVEKVRILEGGYDRWELEDMPIEFDEPKPIVPKIFVANFDSTKVVSKDYVLENILTKSATILDARAGPRFRGEAPEPREGLRSGHAPGAISLPFDDLVAKGTLLDVEALKEILEPIVSGNAQLITSCGSGVTAAVLTLALTCAGYDNHVLYDGSWAEWGADPELPIETGA